MDCVLSLASSDLTEFVRVGGLFNRLFELGVLGVFGGCLGVLQILVLVLVLVLLIESMEEIDIERGMSEVMLFTGDSFCNGLLQFES